MQWVVTTLQMRKVAMSTAELHAEFMSEDYGEPKRRKTKDRARSVRNSLARALRQLEAAATILRDDINHQWSLTQPPPDYERIATAYHEAGHAVVGLALQLPISFATMRQGKRNAYVTGLTDRLSVGEIYKSVPGKPIKLRDFPGRIFRTTKYKKVADLTGVDAFGNKLKPRKISEAEHHAEIVMCIAGGMTEAIHMGDDPSTWRKLASGASGDMGVAGRHRVALGDKAKSYDAYEADALMLVKKFWPMIEAVAAELQKRNFLSAYDMDLICRRVVRRQHLTRDDAPPRRQRRPSLDSRHERQGRNLRRHPRPFAGRRRAIGRASSPRCHARFDDGGARPRGPKSL